ncbi:MAG: PLP-dependent aminotransferase family protein [Actinomycetota bacterium]|nr:PLP-dependent aminotransferase family protein [Actinomycetota bacterium]
MNAPALQTDAAELASMLGDWASSAHPLYQDLGIKLESLIQEGHLAPETLLPPERVLAAALVVSRTTVTAAYDALRARGLVETLQGSGTWVRSRSGDTPVDPAATFFPWPNLLFPAPAKDRPTDPEVLGLRSTDVPASSIFLEAIETMTPADWRTALGNEGYLPAGVPELRAAIARHLTAQGLPTSADELMITTGAQQALHLVISLYVRPGRRVVLEDPTYAGALPLLRSARARLVPVPIDEHGMCIDRVREAMTTGAPALIYVVPTYHNPTGVLLSEQRRRELVGLASRKRVPIVESLALMDTGLTQFDPPPPLGAIDRQLVISIGSLSTLFWAGLRIGWIRAEKSVLGRLKRLKANLDLGTPLIGQFVAARALERAADARLDRAQQLRANYQHLVSLLESQIPEWSVTEPAGGASLWTRVPFGSATEFAQLASRQGVALLPGPMFSPTRGHDDHLRIPFVLDDASMTEAVARLRAAWSDYSQREPHSAPAAQVAAPA